LGRYVEICIAAHLRLSAYITLDGRFSCIPAYCPFEQIVELSAGADIHSATAKSAANDCMRKILMPGADRLGNAQCAFAPLSYQAAPGCRNVAYGLYRAAGFTKSRPKRR
jgi:hypothetical protein